MVSLPFNNTNTKETGSNLLFHTKVYLYDVIKTALGITSFSTTINSSLQNVVSSSQMSSQTILTKIFQPSLVGFIFLAACTSFD